MPVLETDPRCHQLLVDPGFRWNPDLGVWINKVAACTISAESVRDRGYAWVKAWVETS